MKQNERNNLNSNSISRHDQIKHKIAQACAKSGFKTKKEHSGGDWRADVLASKDDLKYAFEVQITQQSLNRTLERQAKYIRDGVVGCWLFEKTPSKFSEERLDLPLFEIKNIEGRDYISLKDRKDLPLEVFIDDYIQNRIKFCSTVTTIPIQKIEISFIEMDCWKCKEKNHIYFVNSGYYSACNTRLYSHEMLWDSSKKEYKPEIVEFVRKYANSENGKNLRIGRIEERFSKTTNSSYVSFGCIKCNSIFGDWFVHDAVAESQYGEGVVDRTVCKLQMDVDLRFKLPHWCHPGNNDFCE